MKTKNTQKSVPNVAIPFHLETRKTYARNVQRRSHAGIPTEARQAQLREQQKKARQTEAKLRWDETKTKVCPVCGNDFLPLKDWQITCSRECWKEWKKCQK